MTSLIFSTVVRALQPLLLFFSLFLLFTGHHEPGGGFAGGLVAASAFVLHGIAQGPASARAAVRLPLPALIGGGLLLAVASTFMPVLASRPFFASTWLKVGAGAFGDIELGTPLLFDIGVYLVVMGVTLLFVLPLAEED